MFNYLEEIILENDVIVKIMGVFPQEKKYSVNINGINMRIEDDFLNFLISKYGIKKYIDKKNIDLEITEKKVIKKNKKGEL